MTKLLKEIKASNKNFGKSTSAEKRVQIAKDVLRHMGNNKINAQGGSYLKADLPFGTEELSLQKLIKNDAVSDCHVCALGAAFYATVCRYNTFNIATKDQSLWGQDLNIDKERIQPLLREFFSAVQLA